MFSNARTRYFYVFSDKKHTASADLKTCFFQHVKVFSVEFNYVIVKRVHELLNYSGTVTLVRTQRKL